MKKRFLIPIIILIVGIILIIVGALLAVNGIGVGDFKTDDFTKTVSSSEDFKGIEVTCDIGQLVIRKGDKFEIECDDIVEKNFDAEYKNGVLSIEYKSEKWFKYIHLGAITDDVSKGEIKVTIPVESFENFVLEGGVGTISLNNLTIENSDIEMGVGDMIIEGCEFTEGVSISAGVGQLEVKNSKLMNLSLECGVGDCDFKSCDVWGETSIENGVGDVDMELIGSRENYQFAISNGLGSVKIDGEKHSSNFTDNLNSSSTQMFSIDNGVGDVDIDFNEVK